jgi:hypothetical protein
MCFGASTEIGSSFRRRKRASAVVGRCAREDGRAELIHQAEVVAMIPDLDDFAVVARTGRCSHQRTRRACRSAEDHPSSRCGCRKRSSVLRRGRPHRKRGRSATGDRGTPGETARRSAPVRQLLEPPAPGEDRGARSRPRRPLSRSRRSRAPRLLRRTARPTACLHPRSPAPRS